MTSPDARSSEPILGPRAQVWAAGDYSRIGSRLQLVGERLCDALDLHAGERVLDVAAGNGNSALAAARCNADVLATDFVPSLLEGCRRRAEASGLPLRTQVVDAEAMPFADGSFDVAISTFGVMFAADQQRAANELVRVVRGGGRIGLANWIPQAFLGELFATLRRHVPAPAGAQSPMRWGDERTLRELLGKEVTVHTSLRTFCFRYASAQAFLDEFRTWYGPFVKAFATLAPEAAEQLARDVVTLVDARNRATDGTVVVPADYLEVVAHKR